MLNETINQSKRLSSVNHHKLIAKNGPYSNGIEEQIEMIIEKLIEHMGGTLQTIPNKHNTIINYYLGNLPDKIDATKAQIKRDEAISGGIRQGRLDEFTKDDKVKRRCEINMTLKMNDGITQLILDDYTAIKPTIISSRTVIGTLADDEATFTIYEWRKLSPPEKVKVIANFDEGVVFTPDTLKTALDNLKTRVYLIAKPTSKEEIKIQEIESEKDHTGTLVEVPENDIVSGIITFKNGDTFNGTYKKQSFTYYSMVEKLVVFENGEYKWKNGDIYNGKYYFEQLYKPWEIRCLKKEGTYTWADKTNYTGKSFIFDELDRRPKVMVIGFGLDDIIYPPKSAIETQKGDDDGGKSQEDKSQKDEASEGHAKG